MGTRIRGAVLALVTAALFAVALPMAWWTGHPVQDGKLIESKSVDVGLLSFEGCRGVGGADEQCKSWRHTDPHSGLHAGSAFAGAGFATLGTGLLAVVLLLAEAGAAAAGAVSARKKLAIAALIGSVLVGVAAAVFIVTAPEMHGAARGVAPFFAFVGAGLGVVQALIAMRPDPAPRVREPKPDRPAKAKAVKVPKAPKPPKPPKPVKPSQVRPAPIHSPSAAPPAYPPIDFLALMEEDARPPAPPASGAATPWDQTQAPAHSNALPGAAGVLGTSMPVSGPNAQTMYPQLPPPPAYGQPYGQPAAYPQPPAFGQPAYNQPPPPPPSPAWGGPPPTPAAIAPTQALTAPPPPRPIAPGDLPSGPMVMPIAAGQTPLPGALPSAPQTAIPVPPLFGAEGSSPPEPVRTAPTAPPPFRSGKPAPPPPRTKAPSQAPGVFSPIPAAAQAALDFREAEHRAGVLLGDHTAPTDAVPDADEPTDTGPIADPPLPPADLDGRFDTASDMNETIERSAAEVAPPRAAAPSPFETRPPFATDPDETVPREKPSTTQILTSAPKTPPPVKHTPPPESTEPTGTPVAADAGSLSTASPDLPPPTEGQAATDGPSPACPQCDSPMNWVEKHLRFYCGNCRMYF